MLDFAQHTAELMTSMIFRLMYSPRYDILELLFKV